MSLLLEDPFKQRILRISVLILLVICAIFSIVVGASSRWVKINTGHSHAAYFGMQWKWIKDDPLSGLEITSICCAITCFICCIVTSVFCFIDLIYNIHIRSDNRVDFDEKKNRRIFGIIRCVFCFITFVAQLIWWGVMTADLKSVLIDGSTDASFSACFYLGLIAWIGYLIATLLTFYLFWSVNGLVYQIDQRTQRLLRIAIIVLIVLAALFAVLASAIGRFIETKEAKSVSLEGEVIYEYVYYGVRWSQTELLVFSSDETVVITFVIIEYIFIIVTTIVCVAAVVAVCMETTIASFVFITVVVICQTVWYSVQTDIMRTERMGDIDPDAKWSSCFYMGIIALIFFLVAAIIAFILIFASDTKWVYFVGTGPTYKTVPTRQQEDVEDSGSEDESRGGGGEKYRPGLGQVTQDNDSDRYKPRPNLGQSTDYTPPRTRIERDPDFGQSTEPTGRRFERDPDFGQSTEPAGRRFERDPDFGQSTEPAGRRFERDPDFGQSTEPSGRRNFEVDLDTGSGGGRRNFERDPDFGQSTEPSGRRNFEVDLDTGSGGGPRNFERDPDFGQSTEPAGRRKFEVDLDTGDGGGYRQPSPQLGQSVAKGGARFTYEPDN